MRYGIYRALKNLGLTKRDVNKIMRNFNSGNTKSSSTDLYKAGTRYGTISKKDIYKAGTRYGTVSRNDIYKAGTRYGTISPKDF